MVLESGDTLKLKAASANNIAGIVSYVEIFDEKVLNYIVVLDDNIIYLWN